MRLKEGVKLDKLTPQMALGAIIAMKVFQEITGAEAILTSVSEGRHSEKSLHYSGCAIDLRTKNIVGMNREGMCKVVTRQIADNLGANFDVILESLGKANEHIHIEYDPK